MGCSIIKMKKHIPISTYLTSILVRNSLYALQRNCVISPGSEGTECNFALNCLFYSRFS